MPDPIALFLAFVYVSVILAIAEGLRRGLRLPVEFTRKFVHIGVGMIAFGLVVVFKEWYFAIIPPLVFVFVNYVSYRRQVFVGMETGEKEQLGTVYFPIAFVLLIPLLWSRPAVLVGSLMPLTWGDAFAAILGRRFGKHTFTVLGQMRTLEGTLAMFVFSAVAVLFALIVFGLPFGAASAFALLTAVAATVVEAVSPWGIDNLTVPLVSAAVLAASTSITGL